jgi:hypothetical protein
MSLEVPTHFVQQYKTNVELLLQQKGSKLRDKVMTDTYTGKAAKAVEQIGAVNAVKLSTRHADTPLISTPADARWVFPEDYVFADLIDTQDKLRMLIDPESSYARNGAYAIGRGMDDEIIAAFNGTSKTGENGTTNTTLPGAQTIAVGGAGMTVTKLREARRRLMAAEVDVDNDTLYCALTARQIEDLFNETQVISLDYNTNRVLVSGQVTSFMGFNFVHIERLATASGDRLCPCWAKSGMHLGMWEDIHTEIGPRADKNYSIQVFVRGTVGATRTEELKVVMITCDEP